LKYLAPTDVPHACTPLEVVPKALRTFLHWDIRHDQMAVHVMRAYGLSLPRDRELIRQLAFVFVVQKERPSSINSLHERTMFHIAERSAWRNDDPHEGTTRNH
jgi:hypothetical protein